LIRLLRKEGSRLGRKGGQAKPEGRDPRAENRRGTVGGGNLEAKKAFLRAEGLRQGRRIPVLLTYQENTRPLDVESLEQKLRFGAARKISRLSAVILAKVPRKKKIVPAPLQGFQPEKRTIREQNIERGRPVEEKRVN